MLENGIALLALLGAFGVPLIVELGVFLDVLLGVLVMQAVVYRIYETSTGLETTRGCDSRSDAADAAVCRGPARARLAPRAETRRVVQRRDDAAVAGGCARDCHSPCMPGDCRSSWGTRGGWMRLSALLAVLVSGVATLAAALGPGLDREHRDAPADVRAFRIYTKSLCVHDVGCGQHRQSRRDVGRHRGDDGHIGAADSRYTGRRRRSMRPGSISSSDRSESRWRSLEPYWRTSTSRQRARTSTWHCTGRCSGMRPRRCIHRSRDSRSCFSSSASGPRPGSRRRTRGCRTRTRRHRLPCQR